MTQTWQMENYAVAYLDVLGQGDELLKLDHLPMSPEEESRALDILENTAGNVLGLRTFLDSYMERKPSEIRCGLPSDIQGLLESMHQVEVEHRGVSDSFVITISLHNDNENCTPMSSIYSLLGGICGMFVVALGYGIPFRGGIDMGPAVRLPKYNELYGPVLVKAVKLESKLAGYPRVLIGDSFLKYLAIVQNQHSTSCFGERAQKFARDCQGFITLDYDGHQILDVIGGYARSIEDLIPLELVRAGYGFVVQEHERYRTDKQEKLQRRYEHLRGYLESRLDYWGIEPVTG